MHSNKGFATLVLIIVLSLLALLTLLTSYQTILWQKQDLAKKICATQDFWQAEAGLICALAIIQNQQLSYIPIDLLTHCDQFSLTFLGPSNHEPLTLVAQAGSIVLAKKLGYQKLHQQDIVFGSKKQLIALDHSWHYLFEK